MANITGEILSTWQNDAPSTDLNLPQDPDKIGTAFPTSLPAELRVIKSITREFTLDPIWINYTGLNQLPAPPPYPAAGPTALSDTQFRLVGNWTSLTNIAVVGRAVRLEGTVVARITAATYDGTNTTVTVTPNSVPGALTKVEFSAIDPTLNPLWLPFNSANPGVLPVSGGGTGQGTPITITGDVDGTLTGPGASQVTVDAIQHQAVVATVPGANDVLMFGTPLNAASWGPNPLGTVLHLAQTAASPGYFIVPTLGSGQIVVQFGVTTATGVLADNGIASVTLTLPILPSEVYAIVATASQTGVIATADPNQGLGGIITVDLKNTAGGPLINVTASVVLIGKV